MNILLVEDNPAEVFLMKEALKEIGFQGQLHALRDGESAIDYFRTLQRKLKKNTNIQQPDLVLLDLNLPRKNGLEVLAFIKENPLTNHLTTMILSTSDSQKDIASSYASLANSYLVKPMEFDKFVQMLRGVFDKWKHGKAMAQVA